MRDLEFISGEFMELDIPKNKRFLLKYFTTELQVAFLRYYLVFGSVRNFVDHTGYYCTEGLLFRFQRRYHKLMKAHEQAKKSFTEEGLKMLEVIETGQFVLRGGGRDD